MIIRVVQMRCEVHRSQLQNISILNHSNIILGCDKPRFKLGSQVAPGSKLGRILNPGEILLIDLHVPYTDSTIDNQSFVKN